MIDKEPFEVRCEGSPILAGHSLDLPNLIQRNVTFPVGLQVNDHNVTSLKAHFSDKVGTGHGPGAFLSALLPTNIRAQVPWECCRFLSNVPEAALLSRVLLIDPEHETALPIVSCQTIIYDMLKPCIWIILFVANVLRGVRHCFGARHYKGT